jgi:hypothetical protein
MFTDTAALVAGGASSCPRRQVAVGLILAAAKRSVTSGQRAGRAVPFAPDPAEFGPGGAVVRASLDDSKSGRLKAFSRRKARLNRWEPQLGHTMLWLGLSRPRKSRTSSG